jgi:drug/metabolite transporter (DMT)-like permease
MVSLIGILLALVAAIALACQAITIRLATREGRSNDVLLVVMIVNVVIFVPLVFLLIPSPTITPISFLAFVAAGIVGTVLGRAFFFAGIKRVGASRAEPIKASMPLHATLLAVIILREGVTSLHFAGVILIVLGIALVSWEGMATDRIDGKATDWHGLTLPLIAAFFFGLEPIFASIGLQEGTSLFVGLTIKTIAALSVFVLYLIWRDSLPGREDVFNEDFRWVVLAGLSSTGFLLAYYAGLSVSRVSIVVPIVQTSPLLVVAMSIVFLSRLERVTPKLIVSATIIVAGGIIVTLAG